MEEVCASAHALSTGLTDRSRFAQNRHGRRKEWRPAAAHVRHVLSSYSVYTYRDSEDVILHGSIGTTG